MAIDYGPRSIGVALCDELQLTSRPLTTIRRERMKISDVVTRICALAEENDAGALVVGLPLNMDGSHGKAAAQVERLIGDLRRRLSIPIISVDERLTSYEADRLLREMGVGERERRARSDEYAAMIILQDYLDALSRRKSAPEEPETPSPQSLD
ncbi:MAG: Holliday junction resolvase RuvX [Blastocatellia bacterium]|nr:Holliday junction resolvase RuvX [Blastocatellia bacterium]